MTRAVLVRKFGGKSQLEFLKEVLKMLDVHSTKLVFKQKQILEQK